jgi:NADH:ubiquinone oxidoreductase subunit 5 (subunit L)/multisubunit Na+/H+ antiporter MnhA subunit
MSAETHPVATHHVPAFIAAPGETDVLMTVTSVILVVAVLAVGILFLRLHTLPERLAHKGHKLQFEIVAVLGLLALFTHMHIFWVAGLLLALVDLPDFGSPLRSMASSLETLAAAPRSLGAAAEASAGHFGDPADGAADDPAHGSPGSKPPPPRPRPVLAPANTKELTHA